MIKRIHSTLFQVEDLDKTADFYKKLGFDIQKSNDAVRIIFGDYRLAFIDEAKDSEKPNSPKGLGVFLYFEVEDMTKFFESSKAKEIKTEGSPIDRPWGKKELKIIDPDGYRLVFFESVQS